jgi:hypothetical protein
MPSLNLIRGCRLEPAGEGAWISIEVHKIPTWCASIRPDPAHPGGMWQRAYLRSSRGTWIDGRMADLFGPLPDGVFEAKSILKANTSQCVYLAVESGRIEVLGRDGEERLVVARLALLYPQEVRSISPPPSSLPPLVGSMKQTAWAESIRAVVMTRMGDDPKMLAAVRNIVDATWWIANRNRSRDDLRLPA